MEEVGIGSRARFFWSLGELHAHDLITVEEDRDAGTGQMQGVAITLRTPPAAVPADAFDFYEQRLRREVERKLDALRRLFAERERFTGMPAPAVSLLVRSPVPAPPRQAVAHEVTDIPAEEAITLPQVSDGLPEAEVAATRALVALE